MNDDIDKRLSDARRQIERAAYQLTQAMDGLTKMQVELERTLEASPRTVTLTFTEFELRAIQRALLTVRADELAQLVSAHGRDAHRWANDAHSALRTVDTAVIKLLDGYTAEGDKL